MSITRAKTKKSEIQEVLQALESLDYNGQKSTFHQQVKNQILEYKIKFPLLEYFTQELASIIPSKSHLEFLDWVVDEDYIGSYVITGKLLQLKLNANMEEVFSHAAKHMIKGDKWYSCDIISERVYGEGLLFDFEQAFFILTAFTKHESPWVRRAIGVAIHYATKRKVGREKASRLLDLTLSQIKDKHIEVKKGFGWGLKTLTKFHPEMVLTVQDQITHPEVSKYYARKMKMGLKLAGMAQA